MSQVKYVDAASAANHKNLWVLFQVRLISAVVLVAALSWVERMLFPLQWQPMLVMLALLTGANMLAYKRLRAEALITQDELFWHLVVDVFALSGVLYMTGGSGNPFVSLFIFQVMMSAVLLEKRRCWVMVTLTIAAYIFLSFNHAQVSTLTHEGMMQMQGALCADGSGQTMPVMDMVGAHLYGMLVAYSVLALAVALFMTKVADNLRERDAELAYLHERAAIKVEVVRMGVEAATAAHELGTPLATIAVAARELQGMVDESAKPEVTMIESQVQRCKKIIDAILNAFGSSRAEDAEIMTIEEFVRMSVMEWHQACGAHDMVQLHWLGEVSCPMVADRVLRRVLSNMLDNARQAQASVIQMFVEAHEDVLEVRVVDDGIGLEASQRMKQEGKHGVGLMLSRTIVEGLGGDLRVTTRADKQRGTTAVLRLPRAALASGEHI